MTQAEEKQSDKKEIPQARGTAGRVWDFCREMFVDHDFWLRALALKGGGSALILAGALLIGSVVSLPFVVATVAIVLSIGLVGLGIAGILLGAIRTGQQVKDIYHRVGFGRKTEEPSAAPKILKTPWHQRPRIQKFLSRPTIKKITDSRLWQTSWSLAKRQEDLFLAGLAMKGSIFSVVGAAVILTTQVFLLPVIAVGSLVTFTSFAAFGALIGGIYGVFLSARSLLHGLKKRKTEKIEVTAPNTPETEPFMAAPCAPAFNQETIMPANDNRAISSPPRPLFFPRRGNP